MGHWATFALSRSTALDMVKRTHPLLPGIMVPYVTALSSKQVTQGWPVWPGSNFQVPVLQLTTKYAKQSHMTAKVNVWRKREMLQIDLSPSTWPFNVVRFGAGIWYRDRKELRGSWEPNLSLCDHFLVQVGLRQSGKAFCPWDLQQETSISFMCYTQPFSDWIKHQVCLIRAGHRGKCVPGPRTWAVLLPLPASLTSPLRMEAPANLLSQTNPSTTTHSTIIFGCPCFKLKKNLLGVLDHDTCSHLWRADSSLSSFKSQPPIAWSFQARIAIN
jgi:hypothetical protein